MSAGSVIAFSILAAFVLGHFGKVFLGTLTDESLANPECVAVKTLQGLLDINLENYENKN